MARKEAELHETPGDIFGNIEAVEGAGLALFELGQSPGGDVVDTHLQHGSPTPSIHDHFGPRYAKRQENFKLRHIDKYTLRFYTVARVNYLRSSTTNATC